MKILLIKAFPQLTSVLDLAKGLKKSGHYVEVAIPRIDESGKELVIFGIPVLEVDIRSSLITNNFIKKRIMDVRGIYQLNKIFRNYKYDIIHFNLLRARVLGRIAHLLGDHSKVVSTIHGPDLDNPFYYYLEKATYWIDDGTVAVSKDTMDYILSKGISPKYYDIIYNGIDLEKYDAIPVNKWYLHEELGLPHNTKLIGMVAWLYPDNIKGHEDFLKAAKILLETERNVNFVIVGGDPYGDNYSEKLKNMAKALNISSHVYFFGARYDIPNIMDSLFCLVLPSRVREGFGLVLIEAMSRGIPVIGSNIGGISEVIEDGKIGFLIPPGDPISMVKAIDDLLLNEEKAYIFGKEGRKRVEEVFNLEIMIRRHEEFYEKVLNRQVIKCGCIYFL